MIDGMEGLSLRIANDEDREFLFQAIQWDYFDRWFQPTETFVIAVEDEEVGVIGLENRHGEVYVTRIEIHPDWQNRGIGTLVLRNVVQRAREEERQQENRLLMRARPT